MQHDCDPLFTDLCAHEAALHRPAVRADRARMNALLHADFVEFGRSGQVWTRQATLDEFGGTQATADGPTIHAQDFALHRVADDVVLLTYRSAHVDADGRRHRWSLRSSVWQRVPDGWRLRFHQGTPTEAPQEPS
ncbi:MAG: nuclear transport factor 2 family protein [Aquincola sp.]|nr:nuclear transport factor 2 family protein [Aquincola sp.]MDH4287609.1 nuclear transport factor 2 family protein [Aquincola sp.]MDH5332171.1 nuclear transport factor 2 family protein [Aquincola sp.]